ncbi:hypothetical protein [Priestia megaterium]|uniref:hypothetical protein n=1 Tax=Priestia megaterium TaxID=1404 RepID=UPI00064C5B53|nr:hypothetical protein [Priestia megaterium]KLV28952.1 hypothetical protein ABW04_27010 [Priestia megaterium]MCE4092551.1 hypothetical protein [Priestia megaterium]
MPLNKEELIELYVNQKLSAKTVATICKCSESTVRTYFKKYNIHIRSLAEARKNTFERELGFTLTAEMIMRKINEGMFVYQVAELLRVNESTITKVLRKAGINLKHDKNHKNLVYTKRKKPQMDKDSLQYKNKVGNLKNHNKERKEAAQLRYEMAHLKSFEEYKYACNQVANQHYTRKRPKGYELDHKYSVHDGYRNGIPAPVLSHPFNLRLITAEENNSKGIDSVITLEELYKGTGQQWDYTIKEIKTISTKACEYCAKEFSHKNKYARFCSSSCASSWRWRNEYKTENRNCVICGKLFEIRREKMAITCGKSCSSTLNHRRRREKQMEKFNISQDKLYDLYINQKKSKLAISKIYGCSNYLIDLLLKDFGITQRNYSEQQLANFEKKLGFKITSDLIVEKVNEGLFVYQIADMWGVNKSTLSQILKKDGKSIVHRVTDS